MSYFKMALLCFLSVSYAFSSTISVKEIKGKLINHTDYKSEEFMIDYSLTCTYTTFAGWTNSCGNEELSVVVEKDGSFILPALSTKSKNNELVVTVRIQNRDIKYNYAFKEFVYSKKEILNVDYRDLQNITVLELKKQSPNYVIDNGMSQLDFVKGVGRDLINSFDFIFPTAKDQTDSFNFETANQFPKKMFFLRGKHPKNVKVQIYANLGMWADGKMSEINSEGEFSSILKDSLKTFNIYAEDLIDFPRTLNGHWKDVTVHFPSYLIGDKDSYFFDGTIDFKCVDGKVSGHFRAKPRSRGGVLNNPKSIALNGTCFEDSAEISFEYKYHSERDADVLTFHVDKLARGLFWKQYVGDGETSFLEILNTKNRKVGTITVSNK